MKELNLKYDFSVAPMMGVTTSSARYMYRLISSEAILFTEMIDSQALYRGDYTKLLKKQSLENPVVLQVGGSDAELLKYSTSLANQFDYQGINLNVGCPSKKVSQGKMGACLMKEADLVKNCIAIASSILLHFHYKFFFNDLNQFIIQFILGRLYKPFKKSDYHFHHSLFTAQLIDD